MKKIKFLLAFFVSMLIVSSPCYADEWALTYGSGNGDYGYAIQQTADGGFIVAGGTHSFGASPYSDIWVVKLGPNGTMDWQKSYGGSDVDYTYCIQQTQDGGYVLAGSSISFGGYDYDIWVLKLAADGTVAWQKTYGDGGSDRPADVQEVFNVSGQADGYVVAGYTTSFGAGSLDVWVLRLNPGGSVAWEKTYGGSEYDSVGSIQQTFDGNGMPDGYVMAGITESFGVGNFDIWVAKLHGDGTMAWQKTYGGADDEGGDSIRQAFDGAGNPDGYVVAGYTWGTQDGGHVLRLNNDGSVAWQKGFDAWSFDTRYFVQQTADGAFVLAGGDDHLSQSDIWIAKLASNGDIDWQKVYGGSQQDSFGAIQQTQNGGYVVTGVTTSFGVGSADLLVLKLDANGAIPDCSVINESNRTSWNITPSVENAEFFSDDTSGTIFTPTVTPQETWADMSELCAETSADFRGTPLVGTIPLTVAFTDRSRSAGSPTTWSWDFGDQETSNDQNPTHTYTTAGQFTVSLTVSGPNGSDTETKTDFIQAVVGEAYQEVWPDSTPGATPIQDAIDMAANDGIILVHDGTYAENIVFRGKGITVESENGPEVTIIDGSGAGCVVRFTDGEGPDSVLDGFSVTNGVSVSPGMVAGILCEGSYPTIANCIVTNNEGQGILAASAGPTITNCTISHNSGGWGSGISCSGDPFTPPEIMDCIIEENVGDWCGAGIYAFGVSPIITDSIIRNNDGGTGIGGGVFLMANASATITGCLVTGNSAGNGAGLYIDVGSNATVTSCIIQDNTATDSGGGIDIGYTASSDPIVTNCVIARNTAPLGAGVSCIISNPVFANCTVVDNAASQLGGGFYYADYGASGYEPIVFNSILWGNTAGGIPNSIYLDSGASMDVTFCDVQGGWPEGSGNLDCNPDFVGGGDYHLLGSSCCIDAGTSSGAPGDDIDGETRPSGNGYDIGADEYYPIHAGFVVLDRQVYAPGVDVNILVTDSDLDTDSGQIEQYNNIVTMTTNNNQTPYDTESTIIMTETGPATGVFTGAITIVHTAAEPENDTVEIDCQAVETITATYHDLDDGTGQEAFPTDVADTDCVLPVISNVQVNNVGYTVATITWDTDEAADSSIHYGTSQPLGSTEYDSSSAASHTIHLNGLVPDTTYYFEVTSRDEAGNLSTDNNPGQYYQFQTAALATQWATTYGGSAHDTVYSVKQIFDQWGDPDGYIAAGSTYSFSNGHDDYWIVRLDLGGGILWEKGYGTHTFEWAVSTAQTDDGGYVVFGNSYYHNYDGCDFWVLKLNPNGSSAWQRIYGSSSGNDYAYAGQETFNQLGNADGYVMVGFTESFGAGEGDVWVLKLNSSGDISWQKTYGGSAHDGGYDIHQTANGGYVVAGATESFAGTGYDMFVLELNQSGGVEWQKAYDYGGYERANTVRQTTDGGFVVAGETGMMYEADVLILKLDPDGDVTWSKIYSGLYQDDAKTIRETADGNYVVAGWTMPASGGAQQFWVLKLDSGDGSVIWQKSYGGASHDGANSIEETVDGGLIVGGGSSFGEGNSDMWILKLDADGAVPGCDIDNPGDGVVSDASITVAVTNASLNNSFVTPTNTGVSAQNTSAVLQDTCAAPAAEFTADVTDGPMPLTVQFTDQSTGAVTSWLWDFGDGVGTSPQQHPSYTYNDAGDFTVSLTVTGPGGSDTETKTNYIHVTGPGDIPVIDKIGNRKCYPGEKIKIRGSGFGDVQGDSVVHIGPMIFDSTSPRIKLWTDTLVKVKIPFNKKNCSWFKDGDGEYRKRKVWVTVDNVDSNKKNIRILKPIGCP